MSNPQDHRAGGPTTTAGEHLQVIAIDGPAAAGKSTVARALANRLGATYLDTGLLYRAITAAALASGLAPSDGDSIADLAHSISLKIIPPTRPGSVEQVLLDGAIVTPFLRTPSIDRHVSEVSAHKQVRAALLPIQREMASNNKVVMVGRDIASVVVPDAGVKVFLDARPEERARRRLQESSESADFESVLEDIKRRDHADSTRPVAPLRVGSDVHIVNTDGRSVGDIVDEIAAFAAMIWRDEIRLPEPGIEK